MEQVSGLRFQARLTFRFLSGLSDPIPSFRPADLSAVREGCKNFEEPRPGPPGTQTASLRKQILSTSALAGCGRLLWHESVGMRRPIVEFSADGIVQRSGCSTLNDDLHSADILGSPMQEQQSPAAFCNFCFDVSCSSFPCEHSRSDGNKAGRNATCCRSSF